MKELVIHTGIRDEWMGMEFYFNKNYDCLHDKAAISSVISDNEAIFRYIKGSVGSYDYNGNFHFWIRNINKFEPRKEALYVIGISFKVAEVDAVGILGLIEEMRRCHLIFKLN